MEPIGEWTTTDLQRFITQRIPSASFPTPKGLKLDNITVSNLTILSKLLVPAQAWQNVQPAGAGQPNFTNGWVNFGAPHAAAAFYKDPFGVVHLKGLVKNGIGNTPIFTLPIGYRPPETRIFAVIDGVNAVSRLDIASTGTVVPVTGNNAYISLNVSFRSE